MEITAPGGTPSAGESYTLTCTVEVVERLVVTPDVEWLDPDNNVITTGGDITVGSPQPSGTTTTLILTFNPLLTSYGGEYTCRANITIDEISIIDLSNTSSTDVIVQSKYIVHDDGGSKYIVHDDGGSKYMVHDDGGSKYIVHDDGGSKYIVHDDGGSKYIVHDDGGSKYIVHDDGGSKYIVMMMVVVST